MSTSRLHARVYLSSLIVIAGLQFASAQFVQQGQKLTGSDAIGAARQGEAVGLSYYGNTAIVGGSGDFGLGYPDMGASWVFTRTLGSWSQEGNKIFAFSVMPGPVGVYQGSSVALGGSGNTALVGGPYDNDRTGGAWLFGRQSGSWFPIGEKLVGYDYLGHPRMGFSVAVSGNDSTLAIVGPNDSTNGLGSSYGGAVFVWVRQPNGLVQYQVPKLVGPQPEFNLTYSPQAGTVALSQDGNTLIVGGGGLAWVFTRSAGVWNQTPAKIGVAGAYLGPAVALSADGNTAMVGVPADNGLTGAAAVFTRTGGVWSGQGNKLVGSDASGTARFGCSVSLSSDGNTATIGGYSDNSNTGAAWIFKRTAGVWSQYGAKLVGTGAKGAASQGYSVALSGDGKTAIIGGPTDSSLVGASWVFYDVPAATATSTIPGGNTAPWSFPGTGVTVQFTPANSAGVSLTVSRYNSTPGGDVSGIGLSGVGSVYWPISINTGTVDGTFSITLDLRGVSGITNYSTLHLVKRPYAYSPFVDAGTPSDVSGAPSAVVWSGLTSFSEFTIAGGPDNPLSVSDGAGNPTGFLLEQNYPNPFNPSTVVSYQLPAVSEVRLVVYDLLGREVVVLVSGKKSPGRYEAKFDASGLASGVYIYRLHAGDFVQTRKLLLLR